MRKMDASKVMCLFLISLGLLVEGVEGARSEKGVCLKVQLRNLCKEKFNDVVTIDVTPYLKGNACEVVERSSGKAIKAQLDVIPNCNTARREVSFWACIPPRSTKVYEIKGKQCSSKSFPTEISGEAVLSNKCLTLQISPYKGICLLKKRGQVSSWMGYTDWIGEERKGFEGTGYTRGPINSLAFKNCRMRLISRGSIRTVFQCVKELDGVAKGITLIENWILYADKSSYEYELNIFNFSSKRVVFPSPLLLEGGHLHIRFGKALEGKKLLLFPPNFKVEAHTVELASKRTYHLYTTCHEMKGRDRVWTLVVSPQKGLALGIIDKLDTSFIWSFNRYEAYLMFLMPKRIRWRFRGYLDPGESFRVVHEVVVGEYPKELNENIMEKKVRLAKALEISIENNIIKPSSIKTIKKILPPPELLFPCDRQILPSIALDFDWKDLKGARWYQIQISKDRDFSKIYKDWKTPTKKFYTKFIPFELLPEGKYYWRVRGIAQDDTPGKWSVVRSFIVQNMPNSLPEPVFRLSHKRPLFEWECAPKNGQELLKLWRELPASVRKYSVVSFGVDRYYRGWRGRTVKDFYDVLEVAEREGIPIVFNHYVRLSHLDMLLRKYKCLKGVVIAERNGFFFLHPEMRNRFKRLWKLLAMHGRVFEWREAQWENNFWLEMPYRQEWWELLKKYGDYFIGAWKTNCSDVPVMIQSNLLGLWLTGIIPAWGVNVEPWIWTPAGYVEIGKELPAGRGVPGVRVPCTVAIEFYLMGLISGATYYHIEWTPGGERIMRALVEETIKEGLITSKEEVLKRVKVCCLGRKEDLVWSRDFGTLRNLYRGTYGIKHEHEYIPDTGRYFFIPILPIRTPVSVANRFSHLVYSDSFANDIGFRSFFNQYYPPQRHQGDAFICQVGDKIFVINPHEIADKEVHYHLFLDKGPVKEVKGKVPPHAFLIFIQKKDRLKILSACHYLRPLPVFLYSQKRVKAETNPENVVQIEREEERGLYLELLPNKVLAKTLIVQRKD